MKNRFYLFRRKLLKYKNAFFSMCKDFALTPKLIVIIFFLLVLAAFVGVALLSVVYSIPVKRIDDNVAKSAYTMRNEGSYPIIFDGVTSQLDNFTDSIMLLESASDSVNGAIEDAMFVYRGVIVENSPTETLIAHYIEKETFEAITKYPRYWHGYLIFLKPLLMFFEYRQIRIINGVIQKVIVVLTCALLYKKKHKLAIAPYLLSYMMLMPLALAKSLQFSSCFYIFAIGSIVLLLLPEDNIRNGAAEVFLLCGIATAYFDFLTYPISTYGIPMLFWLLLINADYVESKVCLIIRNGIFWSIGFGGMWILKWVLASMIIGENIIADGIGAVNNRMSLVSTDGTVKYSIVACELKNYLAFFKTPITIVCLVAIVWMIVEAKKSSIKSIISEMFPFMLVGCVPMIWFLLTPNHSTVHFWFTNKACVVSVLAVMFGLVSMLERTITSEYHNQ